MNCSDRIRAVRKGGTLGSFAPIGSLEKLCKEGRIHEALQALKHLDCQGICPSNGILYHVLQGCINKKDLSTGREIHHLILRSGLQSNAFLGSHLVRMFAVCGSLLEANEVFSKLPKPNVFTWSAIISAHAKFGQGEEAIKLYHEMQDSGEKPDGHIFSAVLKACACAVSLTQGNLVYGHLIQSGIESDVVVGNALVDMYVKCGSFEDACKAFGKLLKRDVVTWSAIIDGYMQHGQCGEAFKLFQQMQREGTKPDSVAWNVLIAGYAQQGLFQEALQVFKFMQQEAMKPDSVTYISLLKACSGIAALNEGYAQQGEGLQALLLFQQIHHEGTEPNNVTYISILKACCIIAALDQGKLIHEHIIERGFECDPHIESALLDMYAKSGSLGDARRVFSQSPNQNEVTWNAMIAAYAHNNDYKLALQHFEEMQKQGLTPDDVTFVCLLSACSHTGLVDEARKILMYMKKNHDVAPKLDHLFCMVDILGRAGCLKEAEELLQNTPFLPNIMGWMSLLSHCRVHGKVDVGRFCFDHVTSMDHRHAAGYFLMSRIYADAGMWEDADQMEERKDFANAWKKPGMAFIEVKRKVYCFSVGDKGHVNSDNTYGKLKRLHVVIEEKGYAPNLGSANH